MKQYMILKAITCIASLGLNKKLSRPCIASLGLNKKLSRPCIAS
jgi:hypothetical protein